MKPITKAVIPAAGLGTRFLPATKACPKEMLPIVDKPTIQYIINILLKKHLLPVSRIFLLLAVTTSVLLKIISTAIRN